MSPMTEILLFTFLLVVVEAGIILWSSRLTINEDDEPWEHENIVRFIGLTIIVGVTAALAAGKTDNTNLAAVTGIFGMVAGYYLRPLHEQKDTKKPTDEQQTKHTKPQPNSNSQGEKPD